MYTLGSKVLVLLVVVVVVVMLLMPRCGGNSIFAGLQI
jgi:hypothetical protein